VQFWSKVINIDFAFANCHFASAKWQGTAFAYAFATGECIGLAIGLPMA
jgi:hypothetical protein